MYQRSCFATEEKNNRYKEEFEFPPGYERRLVFFLQLYLFLKLDFCPYRLGPWDIWLSADILNSCGFLWGGLEEGGENGEMEGEVSGTTETSIGHFIC